MQKAVVKKAAMLLCCNTVWASDPHSQASHQIRDFGGGLKPNTRE